MKEIEGKKINFIFKNMNENQTVVLFYKMIEN